MSNDKPTPTVGSFHSYTPPTLLNGVQQAKKDKQEREATKAKQELVKEIACAAIGILLWTLFTAGTATLFNQKQTYAFDSAKPTSTAQLQFVSDSTPSRTFVDSDEKAFGDEEQSPKAVITDSLGNEIPSEAPLGEVLFFSSQKSQKSVKPKSVVWKLSPPERQARAIPTKDGDLIVSTGLVPCKMTVSLFVTLNGEIDHTSITINVGRGEPTPQPPTPDVPTPDVPASTLEQKLGKLKSPAMNRKEMADAFSSVADRIDNGQLTDSQILVKLTAEAAVEKMGLNAFLEWAEWRNQVSDLLRAEKIITLKDHSTAWRKIAKSITP